MSRDIRKSVGLLFGVISDARAVVGIERVNYVRRTVERLEALAALGEAALTGEVIPTDVWNSAAAALAAEQYDADEPAGDGA